MKITNRMILVNDIDELGPNNIEPVFREIEGRMIRYEFPIKDNVFGRAIDDDTNETILEVLMTDYPTLKEYDKQWLDEPYGPFELLEIQSNK